MAAQVTESDDREALGESGDKMRRLETESNKLLYTVRDVCDLLAMGRTTLYELIRAGDLRPTRIGKRGVRIAASELARFVAESLEGK